MPAGGTHVAIKQHDSNEALKHRFFSTFFLCVVVVVVKRIEAEKNVHRSLSLSLYFSKSSGLNSSLRNATYFFLIIRKNKERRLINCAESADPDDANFLISARFHSGILFDQYLSGLFSWFGSRRKKRETTFSPSLPTRCSANAQCQHCDRTVTLSKRDGKSIKRNVGKQKQTAHLLFFSLMGRFGTISPQKRCREEEAVRCPVNDDATIPPRTQQMREPCGELIINTRVIPCSFLVRFVGSSRWVENCCKGNSLTMAQRAGHAI